MGSGKSSYAIQDMNTENEDRYIYITPFLDEVKRVKDSCDRRKFYDPQERGKGKLHSFHELLLKGNDVASTHALFSNANETTYDLILNGDYILILDEVMEVVKEVKLKKNDLDVLLKMDFIIVNEECEVTWNEDKLEFDTKYNEIKEMCLNNTLFLINNTLMLWTFPAKIFKAFKEVYVMTYLFDSQVQKYYYDLFDIEYEYYYVTKENGRYILKPKDNNYVEDRDGIKQLINIYEGNLNNVATRHNALSSTWFKNINKARYDTTPLQSVLKKNLYNYFINVVKSKSNENMWTTFKIVKIKLKGKGYAKGFIPFNTRATNEFREKASLAYCVNVYMLPNIKNFFNNKMIHVNEELYALAELLQWIWRSRIREGYAINLYIPSMRMRQLLVKYLDGEI
jgi:hypothetical protein